MSNNVILFDELNNIVEIQYEGVNAALLADVNVRLTSLEAAYAAHIGEAGGAIADLEDDISDLTNLYNAQYAALNTEINDRQFGDLTLNENFANQIIAVQEDYSTLITNEAETRAQAILDEATARGAAIAASEAIIMTDVAILATTVEGIATELGAAQASIIEVSDALVTETAARAAQYTAIQADYTTTNAAVLEESVVRADADSAFAAQITVIEAEVDGKNTTFRQASPPTATAIGDLWFETDNNNQAYRWDGSSWVATDDTRIATNSAAIVTEASARASADSALASSITTLTSTVSGNTAAIASEASTRASADSALSSSISTLSATVSSNTAAISTEASARAAADGSIEAKYSVKVDVNGNVSGFDLISTANVNNTPMSAFNFRADAFNIYNGSSNVAPFSVSGGVITMTNVNITASLNITNTVQTFTPSWTGFSSAPSGTISYIDLGAVVIMWVPSSLDGVSNTTAMTITNVPTAIRPATGNRFIPCHIVDNASVYVGAVNISGATMTFYVDNVIGTKIGPSTTGFTASSSKGLAGGWLIVYAK